VFSCYTERGFEKETPGWWFYPAATMLYEDYLGFIARYNTNRFQKHCPAGLTAGYFIIRLLTLAQNVAIRPREN
jgi:hypothetical protein